MISDTKNIKYEIWAALLMSLTALVTAWSAYQANLWTGQQSVELAEALDIQVVITKEEIASKQIRTMDGTIAIEIAKALANNEQRTIDFMVPRVRDDLKIAIQEWLALSPLDNQTAPAHPLLMPSYVNSVVNQSLQQIEILKSQMRQKMQAAQQAGATSDNYVLETVLFAAVLFFAGIASTFSIKRVQSFLLWTSTALMLVSLYKLLLLDVIFG